MAEYFSSDLDAAPQARGLILAGNFLTRIQASEPWKPEYQLMCYRLRDFDHPRIEVIGIAGSAWICTGPETSSCKARETPGNKLEPGLELGDEINERGHYGRWWLPTTQASAPARDALSE